MAAEALFMGVAAMLVAPGRWRLATFVGAFTLLEAVRFAWPFGGLPLGGVFLGQAGGPLLVSARLGGPLLLSALVWLGGAGAAEIVGGLGRRRGGTSAQEYGRSGAGLLALGVVTGLVVVAVLSPAGGPTVGRVRVAVVQGGGRRGFSKAQINPATVFAAQLAATAPLGRLSPGARPSLVVWPEDVISLDGPLRGSPQATVMARLARHLDATVVAGVTETVSARAFRNEIVAWGPTGRVVSTYEKVHRVPFGEYVPWRGFFSHFAGLEAVPLDAIAGRGTGLMRTPAGALGAMVSFEVFYADRSRPAVRDGAQLLVVPTNTSSYASDQIPAQEVAADRVQAAQTGRALVQAAPTGFSTVVDADGAVRQRSALSVPALLVADVALRRGTTFYVRTGDTPLVVLCTLVLVAGWLDTARRRRPRTESSADADPAPVALAVQS
jgi:apolipoprotein N-acyltransferase